MFTLMEDVVLHKMRQYVGWKDGEGDGIFAPGDKRVKNLICEFIKSQPLNVASSFIRVFEMFDRWSHIEYVRRGGCSPEGATELQD